MKIDRLKTILNVLICAVCLYSLPTFSQQHSPTGTYQYRYYPQPYWYRTNTMVDPHGYNIRQKQNQGKSAQAKRPPTNNKPAKKPDMKTRVKQYPRGLNAVRNTNPYNYPYQRKQFNLPQQTNTARPGLNSQYQYSGMYGYAGNYVNPYWQAYAPAYRAAEKKKKPAADNWKKLVSKQVKITELGFQPRNLHVEPGNRVVWANVDIVPHQVSSQTGWNSKILTRGATYVHTFSKPGLYTYYSKLNPKMAGQILVK